MSRTSIGDWQLFDVRGRRKYTSSEERRRFLAIADQLEPESRALCYVLALTGCRVSEALALTRERVDAQTGKIVLRTLKRRKLVYRAIPVPRSLIVMLGSLPSNAEGRFWTIHRTTAWRLIKEVMFLARIEGPMSCCRGLRHGFGIRAAGERIPPSLIQRWLGHSRVETTLIYLDAVGHEERKHARRMWS